MSTMPFARFARLLSAVRFESDEVLSWPAPWLEAPELAAGARAFEPRLNVGHARAERATRDAARAYRGGIALAIVGSIWTAYLEGRELVSIESPVGNELERSIVVVLAEEFRVSELAARDGLGSLERSQDDGDRVRCAECSSTGTAEEFERAGHGLVRCPSCGSGQVRRVEVDLCPGCGKPCHASEGTDSGEHPACFTRRTGQSTVSPEDEGRLPAALDEIQRLAVEALVEASGSWPPSSTTFARALRARLEGSAAPGAYHAARSLRTAVREELEATRDVPRVIADVERFALEWDAENPETEAIVGVGP